VPQIALPVWSDCYDFAARVEYLGVGVWGNKNSKTDWEAEQLSNAFTKILRDDETSKQIRSKAGALGHIARRNPGREVAAARIADLARLP
jgi:UDP:flavonoid glycosyltransferase YjiC (YdhE family)